MKDADMIFGSVQIGKTSVVDAYSMGDYGPHLPDTSLGGTSDILAHAGSERGGLTTVEFKRPPFTGDIYDNPITGSGLLKIIWATGPSDDLTRSTPREGWGFEHGGRRSPFPRAAPLFALGEEDRLVRI